MTKKIYFDNVDITDDFALGKFVHPVTGVAYTSTWNPTDIEGITVVNEPDPLPEVESLDDLRVRKNQEINNARLNANQTTFTYSGKAVACDQLSRSDIDAVNGIVAITNELPPSWIGGWKAVDNTIILIPNVSTWVLFYSAMVQQGTINFNKAQTLKLQLETAYSAGNRENMEGITW